MRPHVQTAPIRLDVLQPWQVTQPLERFRCEPYSAVLTARSCVERQRLAGGAELPKMGNSWAHTGAGNKSGDYGACRGCKTGEQIAQQITQKAAS